MTTEEIRSYRPGSIHGNSTDHQLFAFQGKMLQEIAAQLSELNNNLKDFINLQNRPVTLAKTGPR